VLVASCLLYHTPMYPVMSMNLWIVSRPHSLLDITIMLLAISWPISPASANFCRSFLAHCSTLSSGPCFCKTCMSPFINAKASVSAM